MIRAVLLICGTALLVTGCGRRADLAYPEGSTGPATPAGASAPPTPRQLTEPTVEARPERDDEVLRQSEEREPDPYDLPPEAQ
jgi:hypothetical protein